MKNAKQLAMRFREVHLNGKWVARTNFKDLLTSLTWEQAATKIGNLNTIAALTFHVNYYIAGVIQFFEGGSLDIRDKYSFDFPGVHSQEAWDKLVNELLENAEKFAQQVEQFSDEALEQVFVDEKYGNYHRNIVGLTEHGYYHLGQISLLKKMVLETQV